MKHLRYLLVGLACSVGFAAMVGLYLGFGALVIYSLASLLFLLSWKVGVVIIAIGLVYYFGRSICLDEEKATDYDWMD